MYENCKCREAKSEKDTKVQTINEHVMVRKSDRLCSPASRSTSTISKFTPISKRQNITRRRQAAMTGTYTLTTIFLYNKELAKKYIATQKRIIRLIRFVNFSVRSFEESQISRLIPLGVSYFEEYQCTRLPLYAGSGRGECRIALPPFMERLLPSLEPETYRSWAKALAIATNIYN
ncbi:hypothetical protein DVH24_030795 [Malus domestica]|uniref:Uncharacterized protein n=1 Tax=Malus domestica TaxID=3750 RepID=A0A498HF16_MALDO|nr:hypothetical protein DVH24_030795 [Malus domestica]